MTRPPLQATIPQLLRIYATLQRCHSSLQLLRQEDAADMLPAGWADWRLAVLEEWRAQLGQQPLSVPPMFLGYLQQRVLQELVRLLEQEAAGAEGGGASRC